MTRARILLADDHVMLAEGLRSLLSENFDVVGVVEDGRALVAAASELLPYVIVADISMPHLSGLEALPLLTRTDPGIRVILLTMHLNPAYARKAFQAGAVGFLVKHSAAVELTAAVKEALAGRTSVIGVVVIRTGNTVAPWAVRRPARR